ncbi:hypothetical protein ARMGADRAFT_1022727 [Armillaria gallica]|uniref:Uncharacterized protein n=1 Tax=Armillaria gallica TaxID=47427 RepID=A0A2H3EM79_ARMGA|nr:hypothetical protein ARMGADRAFT_1022727 [Armillaria gallica]
MLWLGPKSADRRAGPSSMESAQRELGAVMEPLVRDFLSMPLWSSDEYLGSTYIQWRFLLTMTTYVWVKTLDLDADCANDTPRDEEPDFYYIPTDNFLLISTRILSAVILLGTSSRGLACIHQLRRSEFLLLRVLRALPVRLSLLGIRNAPGSSPGGEIVKLGGYRDG